eukprot:3941016-Rhodomonas_salina.2
MMGFSVSADTSRYQSPSLAVSSASQALSSACRAGIAGQTGTLIGRPASAIDVHSSFSVFEGARGSVTTPQARVLGLGAPARR